MFRLSITIILLCVSAGVFAQSTDSLLVVTKNDKWYVMHELKKGEDVFLIARMYHVPPAVLADANSINYQSELKEHSPLFIPLGPYNEVNFKPAAQPYKMLYYKVGEKDNLFRISHYAGVQQKTMQQWNHLPDNNITPGSTLFVGWLLYDDLKPGAGNITLKNEAGTETQRSGAKHPNDTTIIIIKKVPADTLSDEEKLYLSQTDSEQNVTEEKGSTVFFGNGGKIKGTNMYFGFHNTAPKGTVIKVHNPGTDKTVYVKVIGQIPGTKQYYNSIIGIGGGAKEELGVIEDKTWCELKYAPN